MTEDKIFLSFEQTAEVREKQMKNDYNISLFNYKYNFDKEEYYYKIRVFSWCPDEEIYLNCKKAFFEMLNLFREEDIKTREKKQESSFGIFFKMEDGSEVETVETLTDIDKETGKNLFGYSIDIALEY